MTQFRIGALVRPIYFANLEEYLPLLSIEFILDYNACVTKEWEVNEKHQKIKLGLVRLPMLGGTVTVWVNCLPVQSSQYIHQRGCVDSLT